MFVVARWICASILYLENSLYSIQDRKAQNIGNSILCAFRCVGAYQKGYHGWLQIFCDLYKQFFLQGLGVFIEAKI